MTHQLGRVLLTLVASAQSLLAIRVFRRIAQTAKGDRIAFQGAGDWAKVRCAVLVPVLNERKRLSPCLASLAAQGEAVAEILVIDGGSQDGTQDLIREWAARDPRIRLIDASPVPQGVNGKAYGLLVGSQETSMRPRWLLTIDADVRLHLGAVASLLLFAHARGLRALSVATSQRIAGSGLGLLHPAMLTSLVYRFGIPGAATRKVERVQANGQCFAIERALLDAVGGFGQVLDSICEDVTLARAIAAAGEPVGFYETEGLVEVEMHQDAEDAWANWPRSLPLRDRYSGRSGDVGLAELVLVQAAPLWLLGLSLRRGWSASFTRVQVALALCRAGVLAGTARAYPDRPWTYWMSPLADLPVVVEIARRSRRRHHVWKGRDIQIGENR